MSLVTLQMKTIGLFCSSYIKLPTTTNRSFMVVNRKVMKSLWFQYYSLAVLGRSKKKKLVNKSLSFVFQAELFLEDSSCFTVQIGD